MEERSLYSQKEKAGMEGTVNVSTFNAWGKNDVFGFVAYGDKVEYIWCKLCSKHKAVIEERLALKCKAKDDALSYTRQVRFVKKGNVE